MDKKYFELFNLFQNFRNNATKKLFEQFNFSQKARSQANKKFSSNSIS